MKPAAIVLGAAAVLFAAQPAAAERGAVVAGDRAGSAAGSESLDCPGANAAAADAKRKLKRAKGNLRRAKHGGSEAEIRRAERRVERAEYELSRAERAADRACGGVYMSFGDSIAGGVGASRGHGYVDLLFAHYRDTLGLSQQVRYSGGTSSNLRANQLPRAVTDIGAPTDTKLVTLGIGAHDFLGGCQFGASACTATYRDNLATMWAELQRALAGDPGEELLIAVGYHNASVGEPREDQADRTLMGENRTLGCADTGADVGMNDAAALEADAHGVLFADPVPGFKAGGQAYMSNDQGPEDLHPNDAGYRAFFEAILAARDPCP